MRNFINDYRDFQKKNMPFQKNTLINNPSMSSYVTKYTTNYNSMNPTNKNYNIYNKMNTIKQLNDLSRNNNASVDLTKYVDKDKIYNSIIRPIITKKQSENEIINAYKNIEANYDKNIENNKILQLYYSKRNNLPYKNIIKDQDFTKKEFKKIEDFIIHRISNEIKVDEVELEEKKSTYDKYNKELDMIFSKPKYHEYLKKFKYYHRNTFHVTYNPADYNKLKKSKIEYYKEEQKRIEKDKQTVDNLINSALSNKMLNEIDVKQISEENNPIEDLNSSTIKNELLKEFGKEHTDLINNVISAYEKSKNINNNNNNNNYIDNNNKNNNNNNNENDSESDNDDEEEDGSDNNDNTEDDDDDDEKTKLMRKYSVLESKENKKKERREESMVITKEMREKYRKRQKKI